MAAKERPDYVNEFAKTKPERTEIKYIGGYYYLYERFTGYDPEKKKSRKISGAMLGKITPDGLVPARKRTNRHGEEPTKRDLYLQTVENKGRDVASVALAETGEHGIPIPPKPGEKKPAKEESGKKPAREQEEETKKTTREEGTKKPATVSADSPGSGRPSRGKTPPALKPEAARSPSGPAEDPGSAPFLASRRACIPEEGPHDCVEIGFSLYAWRLTQPLYARLESCFDHFAVYLYVIDLVRTVSDFRLETVPANFLDSVLCHVYPGLPLKASEIARSIRALGARRLPTILYEKGSICPEDNLVAATGHRSLILPDALPGEKEPVDVLCLYALSDDGRVSPRYLQSWMIEPSAAETLQQTVWDLNLSPERITLLEDRRCACEEDLAELDRSGFTYIALYRCGTPAEGGSVSFFPARAQGRFLYEGREISYREGADGAHKAFLFSDPLPGSDGAGALPDTSQEKRETREAVEAFFIAGNRMALDDFLDSWSDFGSRTADFARLFPERSPEKMSFDRNAGTFTLVTNRTESRAEEVFRAWKLQGNLEHSLDLFMDTAAANPSWVEDPYARAALLSLDHVAAEMRSLVEQEISGFRLSYADVKEQLRKIRATRVENTWTVAPIPEEVQSLCEKLAFRPEKLLNAFPWGEEDNC